MEERPEIPEQLPILPLKGGVIFPQVVIPLLVGREPSRRLIDDALQRDRLVGVVAQKDPQLEEPGPEDLYRVGVLGTILRMIRTPDEGIRVLLQGVRRVRVEDYVQTEPYLVARVVPFEEEPWEKTPELEALRQSVLHTLQEVAELSAQLPEEVVTSAFNVEDPGTLADLIAAYAPFSIEEKQALLEEANPVQRLRDVLKRLQRELEILRLSRKIQEEVQSEISRGQREYFLREQLKAIQKELGILDSRERELEELREKIAQADLSDAAREVALKEWERLKWIQPASPEYNVIRTYLDWILSLPWKKETRDRLDLRRARRILDEDHYDLDRVKERILDFLAVRKLKADTRGPILCLLGPPGVGKTSLGRSIARALGRTFVRVSLGGVRDEAEIRGHRRTYIGALPGRIIQGMKQAGSRNPVFMLDEIDKVGADVRGDPTAALLEVLDPEQNHSFSDHYLEIPFDLSRVLFIATANMLDTIPPPLRDRMEVIEIPGYVEAEKLQIAKKYLIPRSVASTGLEGYPLSFTRPAVLHLIRNYTREAGVRNLERQIRGVLRKYARMAAEGKFPDRRVRITPRRVEEALGPPLYPDTDRLRHPEVGVAPGLAWTPFGGDLLYVEALKMKGGKSVVLTGLLGKVMEESAQTALSLLRARAGDLGIPEDFYETHDVHIHVPEGAVPKDGPSAGITLFVALTSCFLDRPPRGGVAMTGEITLTGRVLPVGGIKEKVTAAHRAGVRIVLLPRWNEKDLREIPDYILKDLTFVFLDTVDDALKVVFP
ncbi:MAG: endopeptidase La [Candidatus Hydrothermae bacterium]|nr:endopeptidase La [Candidatus Hydrothermae bacterium]